MLYSLVKSGQRIEEEIKMTIATDDIARSFGITEDELMEQAIRRFLCRFARGKLRRESREDH
jgi:hypothetical protein